MLISATPSLGNKVILALPFRPHQQNKTINRGENGPSGPSKLSELGKMGRIVRAEESRAEMVLDRIDPEPNNQARLSF